MCLTVDDSNYDEVDCYGNTESVTRTMREVSGERRQRSGITFQDIFLSLFKILVSSYFSSYNGLSLF
jgi:hypothetical protein